MRFLFLVYGLIVLFGVTFYTLGSAGSTSGGSSSARGWSGSGGYGGSGGGWSSGAGHK
ncbi:putative membrane protein YgcG [Cupriavidus metallidurans]|uniref:hypothetical protein n=1 Tax=Cupriavidus TaxID=106589 RepID=UPI0002FB90A2|nr:MULTISPECIES: hypothetical protein [Cupriavidus]MDE4919788.1 hypothetical protein [Cupriavidus metallidurans]QWC88472.1 hypothetical protein KB891_15915 [Cupriavidus metallidurans]UBM10863.1 hypothetical protein LAI70_26950 [Cupriavidus metallidurans]GMG91694.1 hypothetical protein Cmtc_29140 [Cupriavidus sp. TKC]